MAVATRRTECPISREKFFETAQPITAQIAGTPVVVPPKEFSSGSFGFYTNGKITMMIDGKAVVFQMAVQLTAVNSKPQA